MKIFALFLAVFGLLLHAYTAFFKGEGGVSDFSVGLMIFSWAPYLISMLLIFTMRRTLIPLCGLVIPVFMDMLVHYSVFINPQSSTASLGLLFMPLWNILLFLPLGLLSGWILAKGMENVEPGQESRAK